MVNVKRCEEVCWQQVWQGQVQSASQQRQPALSATGRHFTDLHTGCIWRSMALINIIDKVVCEKWSRKLWEKCMFMIIQYSLCISMILYVDLLVCLTMSICIYFCTIVFATSIKLRENTLTFHSTTQAATRCRHAQVRSKSSPLHTGNANDPQMRDCKTAFEVTYHIYFRHV